MSFHIICENFKLFIFYFLRVFSYTLKMQGRWSVLTECPNRQQKRMASLGKSAFDANDSGAVGRKPALPAGLPWGTLCWNAFSSPSCLLHSCHSLWPRQTERAFSERTATFPTAPEDTVPSKWHIGT